MTFAELIAQVRQQYLGSLSRRALEVPAHIEPALRNSDGSLSVENQYGLPCRVDLIPKTGAQAGQSLTVDSESKLTFEPIKFIIGSTSINISPVAWDWVPIRIEGVQGSASKEALVSWFMKWFDPDDENSQNSEGLFGVVHFMSDPETEEFITTTQIDLGSAPVEALEDLLFRIADIEAGAVHVG